MTRLAVALALVCSVGLMTLSAQRIVTHDAQPFLKQVFPAAVAFSTHQGIAAALQAFGVDAKVDATAPHAVSRATISVASAARAVRDSSRVVAKQFLNPAMVK